MSHVPLNDFLAQMAAMLAGQQSAAQCEAAIGTSPSGTARFAVYRTLVERQHRGVLESFFHGAMVAARSWDAARCERLQLDFMQAYPPTGWAPIPMVLPFADFVESYGAPTDVIELADFARARHDVMSAAPSDGIEGLAVRHYSHAIGEFINDVERDKTATGRPRPEPTVVLLGRNRHSSSLVLVSPSLPTLVALQLVEDRVWSDELPVVDHAHVAHEAAFLYDHGLLSAAALAVIQGCL